MIKTRHVIYIFLLSLFLSPKVCPAADKWDFVIAPYLLLPYITGDSSVGAIEGAEIDISSEDIFDSLQLGGMIQAEAHHESGYGFSLAYNFMDLSSTTTGAGGLITTETDIFQGIFEGYAMYRIKTIEDPLEFYGGVRWWDMDVDVNINGTRQGESGEDWIDPVIGIRWMPQIAENWSLIIKGDIGGFGVGSDFTWNLQGGVAWDVTDYLTLVFEYRALSVDYSTGTEGTPDRFVYDTITHGPMFGLAFRL